MIKREALRYYLDCSVTLCPSRAKKIEHYLSCTIHLALQHYRGGHPVPRAVSLYDGGPLVYANILANVGYFSLLFAF
jgi:hypothetical protein